MARSHYNMEVSLRVFFSSECVAMKENFKGDVLHFGIVSHIKVKGALKKSFCSLAYVAVPVVL